MFLENSETRFLNGSFCGKIRTDIRGVRGGSYVTEIRFLHAADLHLDTPFKGMAHFPEAHLNELRESTFQAFDNLVEYALETKPDFIVIVGDIYDGEDRSLRAQLKFQEGMKKLAIAKIPVFLSYGNHDHLKGNWTRFDLPENVHVFQGAVEKKSLMVRGEMVNLYGFSYPERHVREVMIDAYPIAQSDAFHIGLLHGSVEGDDSHAVYAPFTKAEMLSKRYDYWALGHIHKRQHLHEAPPIVYPGNLQGRHRNERGIKGFYEVSLSKQNAKMTFVPASTVIFDQVIVSCEGVHHAGEWFDRCQHAIDAFQEEKDAAIVTLQMVAIDEEAASLFRQSSAEEWLQALRDQLQSRSPFIWIDKIKYEQVLLGNEDVEVLMNPVLSVVDSWQDDQWHDVLKDLYQHTRSFKYLERLTAEDFQEIRREVAQNLVSELSERK